MGLLYLLYTLLLHRDVIDEAVGSVQCLAAILKILVALQL